MALSSTPPTTAVFSKPNPSLPSPSALRFRTSLPSFPAPTFVSLLLGWRRSVGRRLCALVAEEERATAVIVEDTKVQVKPCELYVCNLPRSCGEPELLELFRPFGSVQALEISKNTETGTSKGCGFVSLGSILEAKAAIAALDGSDFGGRELRVKYSADMVPRRKRITAQNESPEKDEIFETPHKLYAGNLSWSVTPQDLREYFSQFGTVVSTKLLHDRKGGKNRVYAFLSFSTDDELKAAVSSSGTEFLGRTMSVREVAKD